MSREFDKRRHAGCCGIGMLRNKSAYKVLCQFSEEMTWSTGNS